MYTRTLILALTLVLLVVVPLPSRADRGVGFTFSTLMGMTMNELSTAFRKMKNAKGWTPLASGRLKGGATVSSVMWSFSEGFDSILCVLENGHVNYISLSAGIGSADDTEYTLNRSLTAVNKHEWVDRTGRARWKLTRMPDRGRFELELTPYTPRRK